MAGLRPALAIFALALLFCIVVADADAQTVPTYTQSSTGLPTQDIWTTKLVFFDIDEDGDQDLLALGPRKGNAAKNMHVWKWTGTSWSEATTAEGLASIDHSSYGGFAFADFDNDGDWDIGAGSHGADDVNAYSKFTAATYTDSSTGLNTARDAWNIEFGDYNSDGDMDILETGFWGMDTRPFAGSGLGTWLDQSADLPDGSSRVDGMFCDINMDGNLDIIATWSGGDWVYVGDGNGSWTNSSTGLPRSSVGFGRGINYGDFNNDGFTDIVMSAGSETRAYAGDGTGNWTNVSAGLPQYTYSSIAMGDMNGDKYDDMVGMINSDPGVVELHLYTGANSWVKADTTTMTGNGEGWRVGIGDFDNNGFNDIVAGFGTDSGPDYPGSIRVWRESTAASDLDVELTFPDGGEMFLGESAWFIKWLSEVPSTSTGIEIELEYSTDGDDGPWTSIDSGLPNSGIYQWAVPDEVSGDCFIRITITDSDSGEASDTNDNAFGIGTSAGGAGEREPHDPIDINSDAEWTAANGVRSGSGTEADPYIIERWDIWGDDSTCISISDTRSYAIIRDCHLHNTTGLAQGISLTSAENITIEDNDIDHTHHGVHASAAEFLLRDNRIIDIEARGVMVSGETNRITAIGNLLRDTGAYGFNLDGSGGMWWSGQWKYPALLENNTISGAANGIYLRTASGVFRGNVIKDCSYGVHCTLGKSFDKAVNCTFEDNLVRDNDIGMFVALMHEPLDGGRSWSVIRGNRFERNIVKGLNLAHDADYTIENNTIAFNPVGIDDVAYGNRTYRNNTIKYNLGGLTFRSIFTIDPDRERVQLAEVLDNDIVNNAYYGIMSSYHNYPGEVSGNYYGGVPGIDGDLLDGNIGGGYQGSPNDPETPAISSPVIIVNDGMSISIDSDRTLNTSYFVRWGGEFELDGADIDLAGHWIAGKIGSYLNTSGGSMDNGLTLALATDHAMIEGTSFDNMAAAVSVYRASPYIGNITVTNDNTTFDTSGTIEHIKFVIRRAGIYLFRDTATIQGGTLNTGGWFGIYAMYSKARITDTAITNNDIGVGAREGHLTLKGLTISLCSMAGIANDDDWWKYGNMSIDIDGCDLQNNDIGIELAYGQIEGEGTPHDITITNNTIDGGTHGLYLEIEDVTILGNEVTNNGVYLDASRAIVKGNTISSGTGLMLVGNAIRMENNTFDQNVRGLYVHDSAPIVVNNDFTRNQYGVYAQDQAQPKLKFNNFEDNTEYGVYNDDSSTLVNATFNWWNSASGPGGEGSGDGDDVSEYVAFEPWLLVESDHSGHYQNIAPKLPTVIIPTDAGFFLRASGRTEDPEGDIVRSVEVMLENETYSSGWIEANGSWRDVLDRGGYSHAFDTMAMEGEYDLSIRCYDGNDHSPIALTKVTVVAPYIEDHDPIVIEGNSDLTSENGVRSGSGTAEDPYMIERWNISSMDSTALDISDTTAHVVISLCNIYGNGSNGGISIVNSRNVVVEDCRFVENSYAIRIADDSLVDMDRSMYLGSEGDDIYSRDSLVNITDSVFWTEGYPANLEGGPEVPSRVSGCFFTAGTLFVTDINLTFEDNVMIGGQLFGGSMSGDIPYYFNISDNVFAYGSAGIWFNWGNSTIERNLLVDHINGWGVWGDRSNMTMRDNNIFGNRDGVENGDDLITIDARWNWWGAENGPSGEGDGDGDAVSEDVLFDPWLTEPVVFNEDPVIVIAEPDGANDTSDNVFTIIWNATDPDGDDITVDLYWDVDNDPGGTSILADDMDPVGTFDWDISMLDEGDYYVYATAEDSRGGMASAYSDGPVTVDHAPSIEVTTPPEGGAEAEDEYSIEWTTMNATDSAIIDIYYDVDTNGENLEIVKTGLNDTGSYDWGLDAVQDGEYYVFIVLTDGEFNATGWSSGMLTVDHPSTTPVNHKPKITVHAPEAGKNNTANEEFTITWTASDEDGDEVYIRLQYDEDDQVGGGVNITSDWVLASLSEWDWDTTDVPEGKYYVYAVVDDSNGSQAHDFSSGRVTIVHPEPGENTAPTITIVTPEDGATVNGTVWINGTAHDADGNDDIERVRIRIGSGSWRTCDGTSDWSYEWNASNADNGDVTIRVEVEDAEGDTGTDQITLTVDNFIPGPPWISIISHDEGETVSGTIEIWGSAGGDLDLERIILEIDGTDVDVTGLSFWEGEWDSSHILYESVTIVATVEDEDGRTNTSTMNITVDNIPPVVNEDPTINVESGPTSVRKGRTVTIVAAVDDPDGRDDIVTVFGDLRDNEGNTVLEITDTELNWVTGTVYFSIDTSSMETGNYILFIFIVDSQDAGDYDTWSFKVVAADSDDKDDSNDLVCAAVFIGIGVALLVLLSTSSRKGEEPVRAQVLQSNVVTGQQLPPPPGQPLPPPPPPPPTDVPPPPPGWVPPPPEEPIDVEVYEVEVLE